LPLKQCAAPANVCASKAKEYPEMPVLTSVDKEHFLKAITDAMPGMVAYWDCSLLCRFANKHYLEWFGKRPEELIGRVTLRELLGEQLFALNEPYIQGALAGLQQRFERTLTKADGTIGFTWANYVPDVDDAGVILGFSVLVTDVTPLKEAEAGLELAASVYTHTDDGITITDANGTILTINPAFTQITGYAAEEVIGKNPRILKSNRQDKAFYAAMWHNITTKGRWVGEIWNRRKNGEIYPERMAITVVRDSAGAPLRYVAVFNDISDLWRKDEHIRHLAFHDALTDLPNRALLIERLDHQIAMSVREHRGLAVMFLDLDGFKLVNDTLGHDVGDEVLKAVTQKLLALVRQTDTVARLGGDEFVIMLDNPANRDEVVHIVNRIVATINEPISVCGMAAHVGTSIGIAMFPADGNTPSELIKSADTAMYAAKTYRKNSHRFFDATMTAH
jgi:diguanylate cyclase (GGDEF)-like protein/PAS domain S-box-containing protein